MTASCRPPTRRTASSSSTPRATRSCASARAAYALLRAPPVTNAVTPTTANPPLAVPLTFAGLIRLDSAVNTARAAGLSPASVAADFQPARIQTWNVNVQRQIGRNLGLMAGYFGSRGDDLRVS